MPIDMGWLLADRVMMMRFEGVVSDADMDAMDKFLTASYDNSQQPVVHLIIDTRAITVQTSLRKALRLKSNRHPRRGWVITVGALTNGTSRFILGTLTTMFRVRHRDVEEPFVALDILQKMDPALPDLVPARSHLADFYAEPVL